MRIIDPSSYDARQAADRLVSMRELNLGGASAVPRVVQILEEGGRYLVSVNFIVGLRPEAIDDVFEGVERRQFAKPEGGGRFRCCICGRDTTDAFDYIEVQLSTDFNDSIQRLGAHASCLNDALHTDIRVEIV